MYRPLRKTAEEEEEEHGHELELLLIEHESESKSNQEIRANLTCFLLVFATSLGRNHGSRVLRHMPSAVLLKY